MTFKVIQKHSSNEPMSLEEYVRAHTKPRWSGVGGSGAIERLEEEIEDLHSELDRLTDMFARLLENALENGAMKKVIRSVVEGDSAEHSDYRIKKL